MKWSINQLQKLRDKGLELNETMDLEEELKRVDSQIRGAAPVHVTGKADIGSSRITFHLKIEGALTLPCSRTLKDVHYPYHIESKETFLLNSNGYDSEEESDEVHLLEGDVLNLTPVIVELIVLEIPMQVYSEEAKNEDDFHPSGQGWEFISEKQKKDKIDPRLAELSKLLQTDKDQD
ncbi:MAG TPA: DUF177 domain-containing protein [Bacillus sp. (in: firmicutes)]|uniref:YceD family protein n=1 Tax=Bacillus litorisediminis TaxID=2922713 RepID=UPI001FAB8AFD|nr:DUF177 domain-containing protein [Bacillus litorisediminis]HWO77432.1 DUF177 domain-containing protein [Bacillus sp. (in: firmicutes)]